jgi:hypothetical protein
MTRKHLLLASAILLVFGGFYFLFHQTQPLMRVNKKDESKVASLSGQTVESLRKNYPHLQPPPDAWFEQMAEKPTLTWEEWIETSVELAVNRRKFSCWNNGNPMPWFLETYNTPAKLAPMEAEYRKFFEKAAQGWQRGGWSVPPTASSDPPEYLQDLAEHGTVRRAPTKIYEGPQTTEAIMEEFDAFYSRIPTDRSTRMDTAYPKEAWIQTFLDKGAQFMSAGDYHKYLDSRAVLMQRAKDPSVWASEVGGVRPASTLEAYTDAFIEREIWIQETWKRARRENPDMTGMAIEGDHYLPLRPNLTYVRSDGSGGIESWGRQLSLEDHDNLRRGIEPKGIEIVYIDEDYNLTEKPPPYDPNSRDSNKLIEKALKERIPEGFQKSPEVQTFEESEGFVRESFDVAPMDPNDVRRAAVREAAAQAAAKAEFERFQNTMRQREEFKTMTDREVSRELARQFSQQFLSKRSLKQGTSKGLENALELMFQHGFEEGFRRVRRDSPSIADELERYLGETQRPPERQKSPQRSAPPKPPETAPPQPEAP